MYCGHKWSEYVYSSNPFIRCPTCKETKNITQLKEAGGTKDVFGYGDAFRKSSPAVPTPSDPDDYIPGDTF